MLLFASAFVVLSAFCDSLIGAAQPNPLSRRYDEKEIEVDDSKHDVEFFNFVTRPDIDAPRWEIKVLKPDEPVAPGLWFVAPYGKVEQTHNDKAYVAPHIYDQDGELIWSGAALLHNTNTFGFKVSNVMGKDMLTAIYPKAGHGLLINDAYEIEDTVDVGEAEVTTNMHEFQIVDNGTKALYLTKEKTSTISNAQRVGYEDGPCEIAWNGVEERDLVTGEVTFSWLSRDQITLEESVMYQDDPVEICEKGEQDYLHMNAAEKLPDETWIVSARRTNTLYKLAPDGSIVWRLGGKFSDFEIDGHFSGQHDVRCLDQNSTHLTLTIMDNAIGPGWPVKTNPNSRGLVLSVNTEAMTAKAVKAYDHPLGRYAHERGNFQTLPNGNALVFWTSDGLNSEHTPGGDVIQWSRMKSGLKTYRGYKFEWVGRPKTSPDVHSQAVLSQNEKSTHVHVSWNGATEVKVWNVYSTARDGSDRKLLMCVQRTGFETSILATGHIQHVVVEGIDGQGEKLGESKVFETLDAAPGSNNEWQAHHETTSSDGLSPWYDGIYDYVQDPIFAFIGGALFCLAAIVSGWGLIAACRRCSRRREKTSYIALAESEEDEEETKALDNKVSDDYDPRQIGR